MAKRKKNSPATAPQISKPQRSNALAISVIIPMFNAERFISECLDSLLGQTFQNFELIVVDDCSTDNSFEIVESYAEKFGERLTLTRTEKNSGGGGYIPRNIGLGLARGEYIYFMDADDFILLTALETLYAAAKEYDADVVYFSEQYCIRRPNDIITFRDKIGANLRNDGREDEPTLIVDDPNRILQEALLKEHHRTPWTKLILRTLLTENNILFPEIVIGGDALWTFRVYAHSKRFLRLPTSIYFLRRYHSQSVIKTKRPSDRVEYDPYLILGFIKWLKEFGKLSHELETLKKNPDLCCQSVNEYFEFFTRRMNEDSKRLCVRDLRDILRRELAKENDFNELIALFLNTLDAENPVEEVPPIKSTCAVSVIISLYNYEAYVGECLDSLLAQTFTDFEVIVVDDCSTDNSFEIVESYAPKFDGRLKLTRTEQNTGGGGTPRNIGLGMAVGEYVFFMDADDVLTDTALEEMHTLADTYYTDVVYCEKYYTSEGVGQELIDNACLPDKKCQEPPFVDKPTFETLDMNLRVRRAMNFKYWVTAWLRFVRRDFLLENNIKFLSLIGSNDVGWSYQVLFCSKRFLRVPNVCYIRRVHDASVTFRERDLPEHVHKWMDRTIRSLKYMDTFMGNIPFFQENPKLRYGLLNYFLNSDFRWIEDECKKLEQFDVYKIFREKFGDYLGEYDVLVSALCASLNSRRYRLRRSEQRITELKNELFLAQSEEFPAISVIIPMYNAAKYIGECLDSLLEQTFTNFEVIVVDDCSTDGSVKIVKEYMPKFNGRLKLSATKKNSGGGGYVPRNIGLKLADGEYVYFVDADDFIMLNALEIFYNAAKEYDAELVCTSAYYELKKKNDVQRMGDDVEKNLFAGKSNGEPSLLISSPNKNLQSLLFAENMPASWRKFIRRDFLIENQLFFPEIQNGGDFIWTINLYSLAKRFLRISSPLYFYRSYNPKSVLRKKRAPAEQIFYWVSSFVSWARSLNELSNENETLKKHPEYCHQALTLKFRWCIYHLMESLKSLYYKDICDVLCRELNNKNNPVDLTTMAFIFSTIVFDKRDIVILNKNVDKLKDKIAELKGEE